MKFEDLDLTPALLRAVADEGYTTPTPIQRDAIPPILAGSDLIGCAQTGTGKTAAFALPTLQLMLKSIDESKSPTAPSFSSAVGKTGEGGRSNAHRTERPKNGRPSSRRKTRTLVLAPTRELCSQIAASFAAYGRQTALRYAVIYGGVGQGNQVRALQHGVDAIIATPGRLLDLMQQGHVDLSHVEILIFDEADQMLDMGFIHDLRRIESRVPRNRQTLMFSATMPEAIRQVAGEWLTDPVAVQTAPVASPVEVIEQSVYFVEKKGKVRLLEQWLAKTPNTRTLVFARTKHGADKIVKSLMKSKIFAAAIHGNKSQSQRERALEQFKSQRPPVLVATDIAARGLDIDGVSHVVNYDLPMTPETYVHRIGRTGRAGATGAAVTFCSVEEVGQLRSIEKLTRRRIDAADNHAEYQLQIPTASSLQASAPRPGGRSSGRPGANQGRRRPQGSVGGNRRQGAQAGAGSSRGATASGAAPAKRRRRPSGRL